MKKIAIALATLIAVDSVLVALLNHGKLVELTYNFSQTTAVFNLAFLISIIFFLGTVTAFSISYYSYKTIELKLKKYEKTSEKASIDVEESSDRVKLLEEKIKTLETALEETLTKK